MKSLDESKDPLMLTFKQLMTESKKVYSKSQAEDKFMLGHCRSFARALHQHIGGEIKALHKNGKELHVYVHKDGSNYDVHGKRSTGQMLINLDGSLENAHKWSVHPVDHTTMKTKPGMVDNATRYIKSNLSKFK